MKKILALLLAIMITLLLTAACDLLVVMDPKPTPAPTQGSAQAQPTPEPTSTPSPVATVCPTPTPSPTPSPTAEPTPTPAPMPKLPGNTGNYLILCETEAQKPIFAEFAAFKEWSGYSVTIKSVEADVKPGAKADASAAIQQYLKRLDKELSLEYVLLAGEPYNEKTACPKHTGGVIPMRYLYWNPRNHNTRYNPDWYDYKKPKNNAFNTPSDLFYAFDFNWDYDKDGFAGESNEVAKAAKKAKPKLLFLLGRIPFSGEREIRIMLEATQRYEQTRKEHSDALVGSYGVWSYYGNALAKNLRNAGIDTAALFDADGVKNFKYKSDSPFASDVFNREARKHYDFVYTMGDVLRYQFLPNTDKGVVGFYFMDSFATMAIEPDQRQPHIQDYLKHGSVCAALATTRESGFNPNKPDPKPASVMFTNKTYSFAREFYASAQASITKNNVLAAYIYCYLGDPSLELKP